MIINITCSKNTSSGLAGRQKKEKVGGEKEEWRNSLEKNTKKEEGKEKKD
jgi:hypothetical protein